MKVIVIGDVHMSTVLKLLKENNIDCGFIEIKSTIEELIEKHPECFIPELKPPIEIDENPVPFYAKRRKEFQRKLARGKIKRR